MQQKSLAADFPRGLLKGSWNDLGFLLLFLAVHTLFKAICLSLGAFLLRIRCLTCTKTYVCMFIVSVPLIEL